MLTNGDVAIEAELPKAVTGAMNANISNWVAVKENLVMILKYYYYFLL